MKNIKYYIVILLAVILFSCKEDVSIWNDTTSRIQFEEGDSTLSKSFAFDHRDVELDTIKLPVRAIGLVSSVDRPFRVKRIPISIEGAEDAIEGVHYKALDSDEVKRLMVIKANKVTGFVPIIVLRTEEMAKKRFFAKFEIIEEGNDFKVGELNRTTKSIVVSDMLEKPMYYDYLVSSFGSYSRVKHGFMNDTLIEKTEDLKANDEFFMKVMTDMSMDYFQRFFQIALEEWEKEKGKKMLDEFEKEVKFGN